MKSLPSDFTKLKNQLSTDSSFLVLLEITLLNDEGTILRFAQNNEDVIIPRGESDPSSDPENTVYSAFPFDLDVTKQNSKGEIPTLRLRVCNITRELQRYLDELDGGIGSRVTLKVVNTDLLDGDYTELEIEYDVIGCTSTEEWATFTLGAPSLLRQRNPLDRYMSDSCRWRFKEVECGYDGPLTTCGRTFDQCEGRNNTIRYGGMRGLRNDTVRLV